MAQLRRLIALAVVASLAPGCRWWRRRHPPARPHAPREVATQCYDARFVTGSRLPRRLSGRRPVVAGTLGRRVFAWRGDDGVYAWWEGMTEPTRLSEGPVTEGPSVAVQRTVAIVSWGDARGASLRTLAQDAAVGIVTRWDGVTGASVAASGDYALWVARSPAGVVARATDAETVFPLSPAGEGTAPALVALDDGFLAAWSAPDGGASALRGQAIALDGRPRGPGFVVQRGEGPMGAPTVARNRRRLLFAWGDHRSGDAGLHVVSTDLAGGDVGDVQRLSIRYTDESTASVVGAERFFGVAWSEPVGGGAPRSYLARIDPRGRRMGSAMRVAVEDDSGMERPSLRWEHVGFVLAMERADGALEMRRTGPRGCDMPLE